MLRRLSVFGFGFVLLLLLLLPACRMTQTMGGGGNSMRSLAVAIDELERRIEADGSVVVKQPDVWGQARLTKHRDEYEQQMALQLTKFEATINGTVAGTDQAYLADVMSLSNAASAPSAPTDLSPQVGVIAGLNQNNANLPAPIGFEAAAKGISLEPHLLLDQQSQYLNHLQELRRINEGDDTADSPGYALNLVRLPVSLLPGKRTDVGYGAEVTMTMRPYLSDELLPTTFRNLVINDLIDQLAFPITKFINDPDKKDYLNPNAALDLQGFFNWLDRAVDFASAVKASKDVTEQVELTRTYFEDLKKYRLKPSLQPIFERAEWAWIDQAIQAWDQGENERSDLTNLVGLAAQVPSPDDREAAESKSDAESRVNQMGSNMQTAVTNASANIRWISSIVIDSSIASQSKSRRAQMPFPPDQIVQVYGMEWFFLLASSTNNAVSKEQFSRTAVDRNQTYIHLPDVQGHLREKLLAAYELLKQDTNQCLWEICSPQQGLSRSVRNFDMASLSKIRGDFTDKMDVLAGGDSSPSLIDNSRALVWAILVESALLDEKLKEDIRESASLKGNMGVSAQCADFYGSNPPIEARHAFNQYVQCRWPIHVFALDPAAQEQNLQSTFSTRREMQLALSLAFVNGGISAQNMLRYARRLEFDYATVDLNGTAIGFSHGEETFGWRFYPRFQAPDVETNAKVLFRDLLIGGPNKNALLRQRRLEPGIRECYAVVIMPSFVPYATLSVSSSWFSLVNPREKHMNSTDAIELGQRVKSLQNNSSCVVDGACYRDQDIFHLVEKVRQLESRLPLQSTQVQIPYENTLGGFAMFNAGLTELAPELVGWYGTSAINPNYGGTVFLVGNHFSVHQTSVIAGGQQITPKHQQLLSRQVIQVTIPPHPMLVGDGSAQFVDVQLATPYGVTQHLLIPTVLPADSNAGTPPTPDQAAAADPSQAAAAKQAAADAATALKTQIAADEAKATAEATQHTAAVKDSADKLAAQQRAIATAAPAKQPAATPAVVPAAAPAPAKQTVAANTAATQNSVVQTSSTDTKKAIDPIMIPIKVNVNVNQKRNRTRPNLNFARSLLP